MVGRLNHPVGVQHGGPHVGRGLGSAPVRVEGVDAHQLAGRVAEGDAQLLEDLLGSLGRALLQLACRSNVRGRTAPLDAGRLENSSLDKESQLGRGAGSR